MCYIDGVCRAVEPMDTRNRYRIVIADQENRRVTDIHVGDLVVINSDPSVIGVLFDRRITLPANSVGNVDGLQDRVSVAPADRCGPSDRVVAGELS
jgi:hypothetical protein